MRGLTLNAEIAGVPTSCLSSAIPTRYPPPSRLSGAGRRDFSPSSSVRTSRSPQRSARDREPAGRGIAGVPNSLYAEDRSFAGVRSKTSGRTPTVPHTPASRSLQTAPPIDRFRVPAFPPWFATDGFGSDRPALGSHRAPLAFFHVQSITCSVGVNRVGTVFM